MCEIPHDHFDYDVYIRMLHCLRICGRRQKRRILRNQNKLMFMIHFLAFAGMYLKIGEIKILIFYAVQVVLLLAIILLYTWIYPKASRLVVNNMCMLMTTVLS